MDDQEFEPTAPLDDAEDAPSNTAEQVADSIMFQALPSACQTVVMLVAHGESDRTRLSASKMVIDYNLKRFAEGHKGEGDYWEGLFSDLTESPKAKAAVKKEEVKAKKKS